MWILRARDRSAFASALALVEGRGARARPLVGSVPHEALRALETEAAATAFPPLQSLADYLGADVRALAPGARLALAHALLASKLVELVEVASAGPPPAPPSFRPGDPAPTGLGVAQVHRERGGRGAGVRIAVVERGWDLAAPRLPLARLHRLCNDSLGFGRHGDAVLAVLCASLDAEGRGGLAPDLDGVLLAAEGSRAWPALDLAADAIVAAVAASRPGDVLLLETQREEGGLAWPAEVSAPIFHAIRLATARGIVVVEAAGNGGGDLDAFVAADGRRPFQGGASGADDSGAVVVGACDGPPRWSMPSGATRGRRVDVVAPGDGVPIPGRERGREGGGAGEGGVPRLTGTSAAAALVAGCVALLQADRLAGGRAPLAPVEVRARLRDPGRGIPVAGCARPCPDAVRLLDP